jgi:hypothetical protein
MRIGDAGEVMRTSDVDEVKLDEVKRASDADEVMRVG